MTDIKKLDDLANVGRDFIDLQFKLSSAEAARSVDELWVLGYCFGVFDALTQRAELDKDVESLAVLTIGFFRLMSDERKGADMVRQALDHQADPGFAQGNRRGGDDLLAWLANPERAPDGLVDYMSRR